MSRRQQIQSAEGVGLENQPFGALQVVKSTDKPTDGAIGFAPGCEWFCAGVNPSVGSQGGTMFTNIGGDGRGSNAKAIWIEADPSSAGLFQFGSSTTTGTSNSKTGYMGGSGILYRDVQGTAISPSATGADKILAAFLLSANAFDKLGRMIQVTAYGSWAATANSKRIKVIAGATNATPVATDGTVTVTAGTTIGDSGALTTSGGGWELTCQLTKYGAANANTQLSMTTSIISGGTHAGVSAPAAATLTENADILIVVTGNAATATTDVLYSGSYIQGYN